MLSKKTIIFVFVIFILIIVSVFWFTEESEEVSTDTLPVEDNLVDDKAVGVSEISLGEKQQIEDWIQENDLNQYGDANDTVYLGGTPLFDESTGKSTDKYEYILQGHSDRPWKK